MVQMETNGVRENPGARGKTTHTGALSLLLSASYMKSYFSTDSKLNMKDGAYGWGKA